MKRLLILLLIFSLPVGINEAKANEKNMPDLKWSYEGETGPAYWGELDLEYRTCSVGKRQSPIDIHEGSVMKDKISLDIQYEPISVTVENRGYTIQWNTSNSYNAIKLNGTPYILKNFHFHTPSEHKLNGEEFEMELHLVHQNKEGKSVVLGVLIQEGEENATYKQLWNSMDKEISDYESNINEPIDLQPLLPEKQTSFFYHGSFTTPPCTEGVQWIVYKDPITLSKEQIQSFQKIFPDNHRPVQPLNNRDIFFINQ